MEKLAEKLSKTGYNADYDSERNIMTIPEKNITVYPEKACYTVRLRFEEQDFEYSVADYEVLFDSLKDILSGIISFSRCDDCNIRMNNWIIRRKSKKLSLLHKIFDFILAVGLLIFSVPLIITPPFFVDFSTIECLIECTPIAVGLGGLVLAVSLIHHALTKNPLHIGGVVMYGLGVNLLWFAVCMLMVTYGEIHESTNADTIGLTVLFTLILAISILFIVLGLRFDKSTQKSYPVFLRRLPVLPLQEDIRRIVNAVTEKMQKETILIKPNVEKNPTIFDSKFGGVPYWDLSKPYPVDSCGNKMQMLAQFNLAELPENEKLPKTGILQFFIDDVDECAVVWHKEVDRLIKESDIQALEITDNDYLFEGECGMDFEKTVFPIVCHNQESSRIMRDIAKKLGITLDETLEFYEIIDDYENFSYVDLDASYMLGNPYFINYDDIRPDNSEYDTLLLQIDSIQNEKFSIYDDCGINYFFINGQKLSENNFDDIFFGYDSY
ncbi:MAG: DUF1963 domain-containing protein [Ruminococcus sp.]|nr:DUF1963 domain-containing protein [Ruminococcus sp.]